ncbi:MAG: tRNA (cytidine(34)-2'-O)-methyltransferase [Pseudomonadota bacterium]
MQSQTITNHVILYEPEIPPNTGNIIRLCANTGAQLHLIHPLGFELDDKRLKRAGLDYDEWAQVAEYSSLEDCIQTGFSPPIFAMSTHGSRTFFQADLSSGGVFLFGPETRGLPAEVRQAYEPDHCLRLPMIPGSRSMNLSNSVSVVVYEALRQQGCVGLK